MQVLKKRTLLVCNFLKKGGWGIVELQKKVCKRGSFLVLGFGLFVLLDLQLMVVVSLISSLSI